MNKAITDGLDLMPPAFIDGLTVWSDQDGTPPSSTYATNPNASLVASDPDFGPCLEILKSASPQRLRYKGETPILPGCYLEVTARVKAMSGPLPQVRIAAFAGTAGNTAVPGVVLSGPAVALGQIGRVYEVRAIIGTGTRSGVDMPWGTAAVYGHVGLDIEGDNGGIVRIESIRVEDRTSVFHRNLMDWVDVRDYGAIGNGVADDSDAFEAADLAAAGREVLVPAGNYRLNRNITMLSPTRFEGKIVQPDNMHFILRANFDYLSYFEAFGNETVALKKALQALFQFSDHQTLDLGGRRIQLSEPIDVHAVVGNFDSFFTRRGICNGQLDASDTTAWTSEVVVSNANYSAADEFKLTNVTNIASIKVGSLVEGFGVGREVYVRAKNDAANEITLSQPLARAQASQSYTFTRFKFILDFSGFDNINSFSIDGIEFQGNKRGSGVLLPDAGVWWIIRNCWFYEPGARGVTSIGRACQGITIEQCEFVAPDSDLLTQNRKSVCFNVNANDAKIRMNRAIEFRHFGVLAGGGNLVVGNHFWQLDTAAEGVRTAGLIMTRRQPKTTITGNYIDNHFIELTNEHTSNATAKTALEFGNLSIVGNVFTGQRIPNWFRYIVLAPLGTNHTLDGISVIGNTFKNFGGSVTDRVDGVDTSFGNFDYSESRDIVFEANNFDEITLRTQSPALVSVTATAAATTWVADLTDKLPFGCHALGVDSVTPHGQIQTSANATWTGQTWVETAQATDKQSVNVRWSTAAKGTVQLRVRADRPA